MFRLGERKILPSGFRKTGRDSHETEAALGFGDVFSFDGFSPEHLCSRLYPMAFTGRRESTAGSGDNNGKRPVFPRWCSTRSRWSIGVWLYDADTHEEIHLLTGHEARVSCVAFSPDGQTLASGSWDSTIRLWDMDSGRRLGILTGHTNTVNTLVFSPDGRTLASGSEDGTALLWDFTPFVLQIPGDVNRDGVVNVQDLVLIASYFGETGVNTADVNGDGVVNVQDLVWVASYFGQD